MDSKVKLLNTCKDKCVSCLSCDYKNENKYLREELLEARRIVSLAMLKDLEKKPQMWVNKD